MNWHTLWRMRILFVADGRSPIALNWIEYFSKAGHEVHLASTFACKPSLRLDSIQVIPVAFSGMKRSAGPGPAKPGRGVWSAGMVAARTKLRQWLGPVTLAGAGKRLASYIQEVQPELVQAMRIPYEGMLAAQAKELLRAGCPALLVSVWGNDFTLHAPSTPWMRFLTRKTMKAADALHADCRRDVRLAQGWGFDPGKPSVVLPGAGGIQMEVFHPPMDESERAAPLVVNPRGFRAYVRSDIFFQAIPLVLQEIPAARFVCATMAGEAQAEAWVKAYGIEKAVKLLPRIPRTEMADLFRSAQVAVSLSTHDGTPNTLLEAMACGCYPVAGDLESVREWIESGVNGLLVDPGDARAAAKAIVAGLRDAVGRKRAMGANSRLVQERAEYGRVMQEAEHFLRKQSRGSKRMNLPLQ